MAGAAHTAPFDVVDVHRAASADLAGYPAVLAVPEMVKVDPRVLLHVSSR